MSQLLLDGSEARGLGALAAVPVRLRRDERSIVVDFLTLNPFDLSEPFLGQSRDRIGGDVERRIIPREALENLEISPAVLAGLVFHVGRCGSTLVSQALKLNAPVFSEPDALASLLFPPWNDWTRKELALATRWLLGTYADSAPGRAIVKLTSWHVLFHDILVDAAPNAKTAFVYRHPLDVASSILRQPPGWAANWLARNEGERGGLSREVLLAQLLGSFLRSGRALDSSRHIALDYADLKIFGIERALKHFGLTASKAALARIMKLDAKATEAVTYEPPAQRAPPSVELTAAINNYALESYDALGWNE